MEPHEFAESCENSTRNRRKLGFRINPTKWQNHGFSNDGNDLHSSVPVENENATATGDRIFTAADDDLDTKSVTTASVEHIEIEDDLQNDVDTNTNNWPSHRIPRPIPQSLKHAMPRRLLTQSNIKSSQNLVISKDHKKSRRRKDTSKEEALPLKTMEIEKMFKEFRNMKYRDCGPNCYCYHCSLLNYPSEDDSSGEELDNVAVAYGFQSSELVKSDSVHSTSQSEEICDSDPCFGDQLSRPPSKSPKSKIGLKSEFKFPIGKTPAFVTDFQRVMNETREQSTKDDLADAIIAFFSRLWSTLRTMFDFLTRRNRRNAKVGPQLPLFQTSNVRDIDEITDSLLSVKIVKNK